MLWTCRGAWFAHKGAVHRLLEDGPGGTLQTPDMSDKFRAIMKREIKSRGQVVQKTQPPFSSCLTLSRYSPPQPSACQAC